MSEQQRFGNVVVSAHKRKMSCDHKVFNEETGNYEYCGNKAWIEITRNGQWSSPIWKQYYCKIHARDDWLRDAGYNP